MNKYKKIYKMILLSMLTAFIGGSSVHATEGEKGSIQIVLSDEASEADRADMIFAYTKVADVINGEYQGVKPYSDEIDFHQLETAKDLEKAALRMEETVKKPDGRVKTDEKGAALIENLDIGVYLIYKENQTDDRKMLPFLVAVPTWDETGQQMNWHVKVMPKQETITPKAPQTNLDVSGKRLLVTAIGLLIAGGIVLLFALKANMPYIRAKSEQRALKRAVVTQKAKQKSPMDRKIDFRTLKKLNPDMEAWIYIPGTQIDYPVLIGKTDAQYLKRNFRGEKSALGAIFGFADTSRDFSDAHICLFGHNMRSAQMFGELKNYKEKQFAGKHRKLYFYTPEGVAEYRLFSVYECNKNDLTFRHKMPKSSDDFLELLDWITEKNTVAFEKRIQVENIAQKEEDQVLTLSCCSDYRRTVNRVTVHFWKTKQVSVKNT